ncbi:MAG: methyltransferase domain-containing protein [Verrucomicrobiota bacterium]
MKSETAWFAERRIRSEFVANRLGKYLGGSLLDVGCDQAYLKELLKPSRYLGVDLGGKPDMILNLDEVDKLPFEDQEFQSVVCCDVLEHLNRFHFIFGELLRVAGRHVVISLPNNWTNARRPIEKGRGKIGHYGLPLEVPMDRHKWFFSLEDASVFVENKAPDYGFKVVESFATEKPRSGLSRVIRKSLTKSKMCYLNRYAHTYWAVLLRKNHSS